MKACISADLAQLSFKQGKYRATISCGIVCDNRSQLLRFSPGVVTTAEDVATLDAALFELL